MLHHSSTVYKKTPLYPSDMLNARLGKEVLFKMECYQPTRSFKIRGMAHLCATMMAERVSEFIASSGGNAGYSLAYAAMHLGGQVKVIVPETTGALMQARIRALGAEVEVYGSVWDETHAYALAQARERGAVYVSPFDDPLLWEGHGSLVDECAGQMEEPDLVVVAVGGGGLLCGVMEGMRRNGWKKARVLAAETEGAASFAAALVAGKPVELQEIRSIAKSLGAKKVAQRALDWAKDKQIGSFVCSDAMAMRACKAFADDFNVLVEPACGAALAAAYEKPEVLAGANRVLVIACGGAGMNYDQFNEWLKVI